MDQWLDRTARGLAEGRSRRDVLRQVGVGLVGLLASLAPGEAAAVGRVKDPGRGTARPSGGGNRACAHFCRGLPPRERGKCVSDAAHGAGLCYHCGPEGNGSGLCGATCCGRNQLCSGGACVCAPGFGDCDGDPSNGCEASLGSARNCGACGRTCAGDEVCVDGQCDRPVTRQRRRR